MDEGAHFEISSLQSLPSLLSVFNMLEIDFQPGSPSSAKAVEYTCRPPSTVAAVGGIGNVHLVEQVLTSTRYCGVCACEFEFITCVKVYHCRDYEIGRASCRERV